MNILVTGGAGYIGSHTIISLIENGFSVIALDNFYSGHKEAVNAAEQLTKADVVLYNGDFSDVNLLKNIIKKHNISGVIHFAARSLVGESMKSPVEYYKNNISGTIIFLEFLKKNGVNNIVFSSSAAVYGIPVRIPIVEASPIAPINVYGFTKTVIENMLGSMRDAYGFNYISLRYFNAAGAHRSGMIGEDHDPETHLIPNVLKSIASGEKRATVFGNDYPTEDGTAIRDYIHVSDLSYAHVVAVRHLIENKRGIGNTYNLGCEKGYSVLSVLRKIEEITGRTLDIKFAARREGDPAVLVASYEKIRRELGFELKYNIEDIIGSAWKWHSSRLNGYKGGAC